MKRLLWIGDAVVSTGFARATHRILDVIKDRWDVHVLGLNYFGDPHEYGYPIYPAFAGGDAFGLGRTEGLVAKLKPDVILIQNDPWNIKAYLKKINDAAPVVASMPVDGKNCRGEDINGLDLGIFWTKFGLDEARAGGFLKRGTVIPLGVDLDLYKPHDRAQSRLAAGIPEELGKAFIVGNVNRNQPRKRLDLTIKYFAEWVKSANIEDAFLYLHVAPTGDHGYDAGQLMAYYGFRGKNKRLIFQEPEIGKGIQEASMPVVYSAFDAQMTTTQGEGWGLTTMEGMACGIPQIVPAWAALGEWTENAAIRIHCDATIATPDRINVIGGVPTERTFVSGLDLLYHDHAVRKKYSERGLALVRQPEYRWESIAEKFHEALESVAIGEAASNAPVKHVMVPSPSRVEHQVGEHA